MQSRPSNAAPEASQGRTTGTIRMLEAAIVVAALLWAVKLCMEYGSIGHDQSWYLYAAKLMLHGTALYGPHLEDSNPPLIYWITLVPTFAAQVLRLPITLSFFIYVTGLAACSAGWCYRLLQGVAMPLTRLQRLAFAAAVFFAALHVQRATDFGQREQFMVILVMPYLVAFGLPRAVALSRMQIAALGFVAAMGFCSKPQQVLVLLAVQAAMVLTSRDARRLASPQTLGFAVLCLVCAVYTAAIYLFFLAYPHRIVPLLQDAYWAFGQTPVRSVLLQRRFGSFVVVAGVLLWRYRRSVSPMPMLLLAACVGGHIAYAAQRTGWYYQQIPRDAFLALFALWTLIEVAAGFMQRRAVGRVSVLRWAGLAASAAGFVVLYLAITKTGNIFASEPKTNDSDVAARSLFESLPAGTPVYVFSTSLMPAFPFVLQRDLVWASRRPHLMMLPAIVQNEIAANGGPKPGKVLPPARVEEMAAYLRSNVTADLRYWRPEYVLVDVCHRDTPCQVIADPEFDIPGWFKRSPEFAAVWYDYAYSHTIHDWTHHLQWDVYVLKPLDGSSAQQTQAATSFSK